jgi:hypothetical protein
MAENQTPPEGDSTPDVDQQAQQQTGQQQVQVRIDESNMTSSYANFFRTNGQAEEVIIDFGYNVSNPRGGQEGRNEILVYINDRVVMNYYSAKRLAITLSQLIRRHEEQFGELELDVAKRSKAGS